MTTRVEVGALGLEDVELVEPDRRLDGVGRDREPGPAGGPGGRAVDPLLLGESHGLSVPISPMIPARMPVSPTPIGRVADDLVGERVDGAAIDRAPRPGSGRRDTSRCP